MTYSSLTPEAALGSNHPLPVIASPSATVPTSRERGPEKSGITGCEPQQRIVVWNSKSIQRDPSLTPLASGCVQDDRGIFYTSFAYSVVGHCLSGNRSGTVIDEKSYILNPKY